MRCLSPLVVLLASLGLSCGPSGESASAEDEGVTGAEDERAPSATPPEAPPDDEEGSEAQANAPDPLPTTIDGLVERFSDNFGLWVNGVTPRLDSPQGASHREVLEEAFTRMSYDEGPVTEFDILEDRTVEIDDTEYQALRISTNLGPKIVLMRYGPGWWVRTYPGS